MIGAELLVMTAAKSDEAHLCQCCAADTARNWYPVHAGFHASRFGQP